MPRRGLFITLEGGEGAGKSLQARALAQRFASKGQAVVCTREPGGTPLGERLREIVLGVSSEDTYLDALTETLLFLAARAALVAEVIAPALERGQIVICDRFADSTRAYQGFGRDLDTATIDRMNEIATRGIRPDLTVLLDLPVEQGLARSQVSGESDRFSREATAFHERVRQGYLTLARIEKDRWLVVDASQPPDAVTDTIWQRIETLL